MDEATEWYEKSDKKLESYSIGKEKLFENEIDMEEMNKEIIKMAKAISDRSAGKDMLTHEASRFDNETKSSQKTADMIIGYTQILIRIKDICG